MFMEQSFQTSPIMDGVRWECGKPNERIFYEGTKEIYYPQFLVVGIIPNLSQIHGYMFDSRFAGITREFSEFWEFPSLGKFSLQHISIQRKCIVWPTQAYVYPFRTMILSTMATRLFCPAIFSCWTWWTICPASWFLLTNKTVEFHCSKPTCICYSTTWGTNCWPWFTMFSLLIIPTF